MNAKLWCKQHSPELLLTSAIVSTIVSIVSACVATKKVEKVIEPAKKKIVESHQAVEAGLADPKAEKKNLTKLYLKTGSKVALYYAPAVLTFGLAVSSMIGSHNIMRGRNAALASAFAALKSSYDLYRDKVKEKIGEEAEELLYGNYEEKKETHTTAGGKVKEKVTYEKKAEDDENNLFRACWGPGNTNYDASLGQANLTTLLRAENYLNQVLRAKGYLFLSDVYEELGYTAGLLGARKLQASHVLGWIFDPNDPNRASYVDFGIHDKDGNMTQHARDFQCGAEDFIWLEFNVDGDILTGDNGQRSFMNTALNKDR